MQAEYCELFRKKMTEEQYQKLEQIQNDKIHSFIADSIELCQPDSVFVATDSDEDTAHIREMAINTGEEKELKVTGHTIHFDGMNDQGRDRTVTRYLVPETDSLSKALNQIEREQGLSEVRGHPPLLAPPF